MQSSLSSQGNTSININSSVPYARTGRETSKIFKTTKIMFFDSSNAYQKMFPPRFHLLDRELAESTLVILRTIKRAYPGEGIRRTVLWLQ
jgi:hypothetical protein